MDCNSKWFSWRSQGCKVVVRKSVVSSLTFTACDTGCFRLLRFIRPKKRPNRGLTFDMLHFACKSKRQFFVRGHNVFIQEPACVELVQRSELRFQALKAALLFLNEDGTVLVKQFLEAIIIRERRETCTYEIQVRFALHCIVFVVNLRLQEA